MRFMEGYREKDVVRFEGHSTRRLSEPVAIEAALSIRVVSYDGVEFSLGITMRTPGQDEDLILGHCITEGVIDSAAEVQNVVILQNDAKVYLSKQSNFQPRDHVRRSTRSSACGICGKESISNLLHMHGPTLDERLSLESGMITESVRELKERQDIFRVTGGTHACALFSHSGRLSLIREDVGRHNALDKLIGAMLKQQLNPIGFPLVVVSGRASFELVQKSIRAGLPVFAAVGAPSTLAVELATEHGLTLVAFVREDRMTVYSGKRRINFV